MKEINSITEIGFGFDTEEIPFVGTKKQSYVIKNKDGSFSHFKLTAFKTKEDLVKLKKDFFDQLIRDGNAK